MPLQEHAAFCNACGTAVRVQTKPARPSAPVPALAGATGTAGSPGSDAGTTGPLWDATRMP